MPLASTAADVNFALTGQESTLAVIGKGLRHEHLQTLRQANQRRIPQRNKFCISSALLHQAVRSV